MAPGASLWRDAHALRAGADCRGGEVGTEAQFHASCFPSHRAHTIRSRGNAISLMEKVALGKGVDELRVTSTEAVSCRVYQRRLRHGLRVAGSRGETFHSQREEGNAPLSVFSREEPSPRPPAGLTHGSVSPLWLHVPGGTVVSA